jgi:CBS domain-containing protein
VIRVDSRAEAREPSGREAGLAAPLADLVTREPLFVAPATTVADVALAMREGQYSSAVVTSRPDGIVTNGDLARVVAERRPPDTPVEQVMSSPVHALPADAPLIRALLLMLDEGIEHVPVVRGGRIVGVVTDVDVMRQQSASPLLGSAAPGRAGCAIRRSRTCPPTWRESRRRCSPTASTGCASRRSSPACAMH